MLVAPSTVNRKARAVVLGSESISIVPPEVALTLSNPDVPVSDVMPVRSSLLPVPVAWKFVVPKGASAYEATLGSVRMPPPLATSDVESILVSAESVDDMLVTVIVPPP